MPLVESTLTLANDTTPLIPIEAEFSSRALIRVGSGWTGGIKVIGSIDNQSEDYLVTENLSTGLGSDTISAPGLYRVDTSGLAGIRVVLLSRLTGSTPIEVDISIVVG